MCASRLDLVAPAGARVALLAHRTIGAYAAVLAAVLSGRAYVPIYPKAPHSVKERSRPRPGVKFTWVHLKSAGLAADLATEFGGAALAVDPIHDGGREYVSAEGDHAYIMFTSGTTGTPRRA